MTKPIQNLKGQTFGYLVVKRISEKRNNSGRVMWDCICECGNKVTTTANNLKTGQTKSCGCLQREKVSITGKNNTKHGNTSRLITGDATRAYKIWTGIKNRCYNKNSEAYNRYGGRGIKLQKNWKNNFAIFYDYIKSLPNGPSENVLQGRKNTKCRLSLDRIDNDGDYKEGNLKWSTAKQQANNRSDNILVNIENELLTLSEACEKYSNVRYGTVKNRIKIHGWTVEDALFTPVR